MGGTAGDSVDECSSRVANIVGLWCVVHTLIKGGSMSGGWSCALLLLLLSMPVVSLTATCGWSLVTWMFVLSTSASLSISLTVSTTKPSSCCCSLIRKGVLDASWSVAVEFGVLWCLAWRKRWVLWLEEREGDVGAAGDGGSFLLCHSCLLLAMIWWMVGCASRDQAGRRVFFSLEKKMNRDRGRHCHVFPFWIFYLFFYFFFRYDPPPPQVLLRDLSVYTPLI